MNKTFYGRINDKEYTNQQDFLKDLQNLQEVSNVEYKYTETPVSTPVQPERVVEDKSAESGLKKIFKDFSNSSANKETFAQLKQDLIDHFNNVEDDLIENDLDILNNELDELQDLLVNIRQRCSHNKQVLLNEQHQLNTLTNQLEELTRQVAEKTKKVESLQESCEKEDIGLNLWTDFCTFMEELSCDVQHWVADNLGNNHECNKCNKCDECSCEKEFKKPDWMAQGYFNLLKEILK